MESCVVDKTSALSIGTGARMEDSSPFSYVNRTPVRVRTCWQ